MPSHEKPLLDAFGSLQRVDRGVHLRSSRNPPFYLSFLHRNGQLCNSLLILLAPLSFHLELFLGSNRLLQASREQVERLCNLPQRSSWIDGDSSGEIPVAPPCHELYDLVHVLVKHTLLLHYQAITLRDTVLEPGNLFGLLGPRESGGNASHEEKSDDGNDHLQNQRLLDYIVQRRREIMPQTGRMPLEKDSEDDKETVEEGNSKNPGSREQDRCKQDGFDEQIKCREVKQVKDRCPQNREDEAEIDDTDEYNASGDDLSHPIEDKGNRIENEGDNERNEEGAIAGTNSRRDRSQCRNLSTEYAFNHSEYRKLTLLHSYSCVSFLSHSVLSTH